MVKISVIVPIYNVEKYLEKCLESLCAQTLSDLEIICIDDASEDRSLEIVKRFASSDNRIKIICHPENMGTLQARKHGVEKATGQYIMFVDGDDWLEKASCEKLYQRIEQEQVDVLQYGTNVVAAVPVSETMICWIENFLKPYPYRLEGYDILQAVFLEDQFDFNITDKIWKADLCKSSFSKMKNTRLIASEDRYAFFLLAYYAKSYIGIEDSKYYNYNVGIGVTGGDTLDHVRFEKRCTGVRAAELVEEFLIHEGVFDKYKEIYRQFKNKILWDCVDCWFEKLPAALSTEGYDILLKYWGAGPVLSAIARVYFERRDEVADKVQTASVISNKKKIAFYCRDLGSEPISSILLEKKKFIESLGIRVVILTDDDAVMNFEGEPCVLLPPSKDANWANYESRALEFDRILSENQFDLVIYTSPSSHIAWLDVLLIKSKGIQVLCLNEKGQIEKARIRQTDILSGGAEITKKDIDIRMHKELVSVIVPVYKVENYLERCIQSIQNQTYKNLEIILVDDGSPDQCGMLCDKFAREDDRITVIHKENGGLSDARNVGIESANGDFFLFVDSDDWIDRDMIALLYCTLKQYNADIAECSYRNVYKDHIIEETECNAAVVEGDPITALNGMLDWKYFKPVAWNKLYKRETLGSIRYPKGRLHEDEFTTYKYFYNAKKLVYVDVSKYNYDRTREDSITGKKYREDNLDACWAFRERVDFFYEHNLVQLQEKMNNIYCWYVLDSLKKCYANHIQGKKVDMLLRLMTDDITYFSDKLVDQNYLNEFRFVIDHGIEAYVQEYCK